MHVGNNPYAVAVANTTNQAANITITRGANAVANGMVPAGSVKVFTLPWVNELAKGTGPSALVVDGAYRLRSTQPVTVYQYNPLNADVTNDASLMLPVNTWTGNYLVASWQYWIGYPGFYSVTASQDDTKVTLKAPKGGVPTQAGGGVDAQGNGVVMMNEGDVLQVITGNNGDKTGAIVAADKPVQVVGGHDCTQVPIGIAACDHLEKRRAHVPIEALAKEYIVVPPVQVPNDQLEKAMPGSVHTRSEDNTTLTFDPNQPVAKLLAKAGDFEIPNTVAKFVVKSDKILVAEYMVGQQANFGTSDPAMIIAVPTAQFRSNYLFYAQTGWQANYVDIIAPDGSATTVDGAPVNNFRLIGATGYSLAHVKLSNAGDGSHTVASDKKGRDHGVRGGELRELLVPRRARPRRHPAVSGVRRGDAARGALSVLRAQLGEQEGQGVGLAGDGLLHEVGAAVAGVALDAEPGGAVAGVLDGGGELAGVHGVDAVVAVGAEHEQGRERAVLGDMVVGRVGV